jgi:hypothetical protein
MKRYDDDAVAVAALAEAALEVSQGHKPILNILSHLFLNIHSATIRLLRQSPRAPCEKTAFVCLLH